MALKNLDDGFTLWFTGLPCSGKTTVTQALAEELASRQLRHEILDGDEVRKNLTHDLGFSRKDRRENVLRNAFVAKLLARNGVISMAALITPYNDTQQELREKLNDCHMVYVNCPVEVCADRDVKGMYEKAKKGEIENFTGISDPYEEPIDPEIVIHSHEEDIEESTQKVLNYLEENDLIPTVDENAEQEELLATA